MPDQKVAVITGTSGGIGLLTAIEFAQNGYLVVATMHDLGRGSRLEEAGQKKANVRERVDI
jgi:NAD(P)-dependent dehydrogenase (short-subunit alcohol dehydrogenase family)